jgi:hypothetical protein
VVRFPEKQQFIKSPVPLQRRCGAHPAFYLMSTGYFFPLGEKRPGRLVDHSPPLRAQVKNGSSCACTLSTTKRLHVVHRNKLVLSYAVLIFLSRVTLSRNSLNHVFSSRSDSLICSSFLRGFRRFLQAF